MVLLDVILAQYIYVFIYLSAVARVLQNAKNMYKPVVNLPSSQCARFYLSLSQHVLVLLCCRLLET